MPSLLQQSTYFEILSVFARTMGRKFLIGFLICLHIFLNGFQGILVPSASADPLTTNYYTSLDKGSFQTDLHTGAATYHLPIEVPPGIKKMQPNLAFTYNSQDPNDIMGMGWQISGLSQIERCGATYIQDGFKGGVNYDADDRFCLDGQRLIRINKSSEEPYWNPAPDAHNEYRTEKESWKKIVAFNDNPSQSGVEKCNTSDPCRFEVTLKDGTVLSYGNLSADYSSPAVLKGRFLTERSDDSYTRVWALVGKKDRYGNYMTIQYGEDQNRYYIEQINYAYNNAGPTSTSHIIFKYEDRPDKFTRVQSKAYIETRHRLISVTTKLDNILVKQYKINYSTSSYTNRSLVSSIQECAPKDIKSAAANQCFPATNFAWTPLPKPADRISQITNPLGGKIFISYKPLTDPSVYQGSPAIPDKNYMDATFGATVFSANTKIASPKRKIPAPINVGSRVRNINVEGQAKHYVVNSYILQEGKPDPETGKQEYQYQYDFFYEGAKLNSQGRGWLGFERVSTKDVALNSVVTTTYTQDFPLIGFRQYISQCDASQMSSDSYSCNAKDRKRVQVLTYECSTGANSENPKCTYTPEVEGNLLNPNTYQTFLTEKANMDRTFDFAVFTRYEYDAYGNLTKELRRGDQLWTPHPVYRYHTYDNDISNWRLGFPRYSRISNNGELDYDQVETTSFVLDQDLQWSFDNYDSQGILQSSLDYDSENEQWVGKAYEDYTAYGYPQTIVQVAAISSPETTYPLNGKDNIPLVSKITYDRNYPSLAIKQESPQPDASKKTLNSYTFYDPRFGKKVGSKSSGNLWSIQCLDPFGRMILHQELIPDEITQQGIAGDGQSCSNMMIGDASLTKPSKDKLIVYKDTSWHQDNTGITSFEHQDRILWKTGPEAFRATTLYLDGLGRSYKTVHQREAGQQVVLQKVWQTPHLLAQKSNPYFLSEGNASWVEYKYDATGRMTQQITPFDANNGSSSPITTIWDYSPGSTITQTTTNAFGKPHINVTKFAFYNNKRKTMSVAQGDQADSLATTQYQYDGLGRTVEVASPGSDSMAVTNYFKYNSLGNVIEKEEWVTADAEKVLSNNSYQYDLRGNLENKIDAKGQVISYQYDNVNRLLQDSVNGTLITGEPITTTTNREYYDEVPESSDDSKYNSAQLSRISSTETIDSEISSPIYSYDFNQYNSQGNVINKAVLLPNEYQAELETACPQYTDQGCQFGMTYTPTGRLLTKTLPDDSTVIKAYQDYSGFLESVSYETQNTTQKYADFEDYNVRSRVGQIEYYNPTTVSPNLVLAPTEIEELGYYPESGLLANHRLISNQPLQESQELQEKYQEIQHLKNENLLLQLENQDLQKEMATLADDDAKKEVLLEEINSLKTKINQNREMIERQEGMLSDIQGVLLHYTYNWDQLGNLLNINNSEAGKSQSFTYENNRLKTANSSELYGTITYDYDPSGNMTQKSYTGGSNDGSVIYDQFEGNRVLSAKSSTGETNFSYDDNGNLFFKTNGADAWGYTYDGKNRLRSAQKAEQPGFNEEYQYASSGRRIIKKNQGKDQTVLYVDPSYIIQKTGSELTSTSYVGKIAAVKKTWGADGVATDEKTIFFHKNQVNSTEVVSGSENKKVVYEPYGKIVLDKSSPNLSDFRPKFGSKELDDTQLYYFNARYYDPEMARFITRDSQLGASRFTQDAFNRYAYVLNNPMASIDPSGHGATGCLLPAFSAIGLAGETSAQNGQRLDAHGKRSYDSHFAGEVVLGVATLGSAVAAGILCWRWYNKSRARPTSDTSNAEPQTDDSYDPPNIAEEEELPEVAEPVQGLGTADVVSAPQLSISQNSSRYVSPPRPRPQRPCTVVVSFSPGTQIAVESGLKNIEDIQLKEKIWGYNEKTRQTDLFSVTAKSVKLHHDSVTLNTESGNTISTTTEHPFYVKDRGWVPAGKLKEGDAIRTQDGTSVILESVKVDYVEEAFPAYNLSVDKAHNFFVSEDKLLVHNDACDSEEDAAEGEEGAGEIAGESPADEGAGVSAATGGETEFAGTGGFAEFAGTGGFAEFAVPAEAEVEAAPGEIEMVVALAALFAL